MSALRNYLNKIKPNFQKGGKLHAFESVFDGFESFLYVPNTTAKSGAHIHDAIDSKRIMSFVVIALIPALLWVTPCLMASQLLLLSDSWLRTLLLQLISVMPLQVSSLAVSVRHPSSPSPSVPLSFSGLVLHLGRPWALYSQAVS